MTVESEQDIFLRHSVASAPRTMTTIGTPAAVPNGANNVGSPTVTVMGIPQANDNIINKKADPAQGLFQTCLTLRQRLQDVPGFEKFLEPPEDADPNIPEDPVTQLWRCFRLGSSLCALFNATQPKDAIREDRLSPNLKTMNDCKAATFHFLKGIKTELDIQGEDAFMIHNLYSDDTNGFVKVRGYKFGVVFTWDHRMGGYDAVDCTTGRCDLVAPPGRDPFTPSRELNSDANPERALRLQKLSPKSWTFLRSATC